MLNRSLLFLALTLQISFTASNVNAANDLEKWNSEVGRNVRQSHSDKLAQTTYREMDSRNVTVSKDMKTVYPQIETRSQVAGSRTRVVAEAVLEVDKDKVWKDWNKKLNKWGKGTAGGVAGSLIVQGIMDAVDWVMDPKNNTIQKPNAKYDPNILPTDPNVLIVFKDRSNPIHYAKMSYSEAVKDELCKKYFPGTRFTWPSNCLDGNTLKGSVDVATNPFKDTKPPATSPVSEEEKERVLKDLLNDPKYADLARDMIRNTYSIGPENPEPDPNIVNDLKDKQKDVLKSDNPKGDGKTRTDPKIDTGTQGQADTTPKPDPSPNPNPNPDPGTTPIPNPNPNPNNGSTTTFELPPFCDYAAIVCDWIDWTKEKPEEEEPEEEEDINDKGIFERTFDLDFSLGGQCPPNLSWSMNNKYLTKTFEIDLGWACMFFTAIGYALLFLSNCIGIWVMYETVVRKELKW